VKNPGIDLTVWKQLKEKWTKLDASGCSLRIDFKLVTNDSEKDKTLVIDVVQTIDDEIIVETVQRRKGEAYPVLGISDLSVEELKDVYKEVLTQLHGQLGQPESNLVITMSPTSELSGEVTGYLQSHDEPVKQAVLTNYQHYYVLNALRERMAEAAGDDWKKVKAVYHSGSLEFYFEY
jgi:hypothetical protein